MEMKSIQKTLVIVAMAFASSMVYAASDETEIAGAVTQTIDNGDNNVQTMKIGKGVKVRGGGGGDVAVKGIAGKVLGLEASGGGGGGITQSITDGDGNKQTMEIGIN